VYKLTSTHIFILFGDILTGLEIVLSMFDELHPILASAPSYASRLARDRAIRILRTHLALYEQTSTHILIFFGGMLAESEFVPGMFGDFHPNPRFAPLYASR
jgi:hypothetical protein